MNIANKPFHPAIPCSPAALRAPSSPYAAHTKAQFGNSRHFQCSTYAKTTHSLPLPLVSFQNVLFFFFFSLFFPLSLSCYSWCHVETGELGSDMAAASKKEPSPSVPASPFQTGNKMAMEQPFCLLRDGREKGREGRRRPGGKDEGGEGRASIRQEPKSSAAMPGRVLFPPAGPVQSHGRTEPEGWTQGWFSSPPKPVEPELSGLTRVTLPFLGLAGTSIPPGGSGPAAAGLCESS